MRGTTAREDHPRPCGEKVSLLCLFEWVQGSPPPMRGKVKGDDDVPDVGRITPAHAGKSRFAYKTFKRL